MNMEKERDLQMEYYVHIANEMIDEFMFHKVSRLGVPYLKKLLTVSARCQTGEAKVVALLQDLVEESDAGCIELIVLGKFPPRIVDSVINIYRTKEDTDESYWTRVRDDAYASEAMIEELKFQIARLKRIKRTDERMAELAECERRLAFIY